MPPRGERFQHARRDSASRPFADARSMAARALAARIDLDHLLTRDDAARRAGGPRKHAGQQCGDRSPLRSRRSPALPSRHRRCGHAYGSGRRAARRTPTATTGAAHDAGARHRAAACRRFRPACAQPLAPRGLDRDVDMLAHAIARVRGRRSAAATARAASAAPAASASPPRASITATGVERRRDAPRHDQVVAATIAPRSNTTGRLRTDAQKHAVQALQVGRCRRTRRRRTPCRDAATRDRRRRSARRRSQRDAARCARPREPTSPLPSTIATGRGRDGFMRRVLRGIEACSLAQKERPAMRESVETWRAVCPRHTTADDPLQEIGRDDGLQDDGSAALSRARGSTATTRRALRTDHRGRTSSRRRAREGRHHAERGLVARRSAPALARFRPVGGGRARRCYGRRARPEFGHRAELARAARSCRLLRAIRPARRGCSRCPANARSSHSAIRSACFSPFDVRRPPRSRLARLGFAVTPEDQVHQVAAT